MSIFTGAGVAIVTPFNEDGSVNYERFAELIEFQIANNTDALDACASDEKIDRYIEIIGDGAKCFDIRLYVVVFVFVYRLLTDVYNIGKLLLTHSCASA